MYQKESEWENEPDFKRAVKFAEELLDEPYADPDDHARTVARQFQRMVERYSNREKEIAEEVEKLENYIGTNDYLKMVKKSDVLQIIKH